MKREVPMEPYNDLGMVGSVHLWGCVNCGSLVVDKERHNEWHEHQAEANTEARYGRAAYDHLRATP